MTKYRPELMKAIELAKKSGIDLSTIMRWTREGKIRYQKNPAKKVKGKRQYTLINIYSFTNYVLKHYRYRRMNTRAGKWWTDEDKRNPIDRTPMAVRVKRCRERKLKIK